MTVLLPTLSEDGWVDDSKKILDYLFSYYILTDIGQSYLFNNSLSSLPYMYYKHISSPTDLSSAIRTDMSKMLEEYFETVEIDCIAKEKETNSSTYYIFLSISVLDKNGIKNDLNKIIQMTNSIVNKVITYNNYGDAYNDLNNL